MARKRVAIIGAGASGLVAIKCCLDEDLEPVCLERTSHIGGLWYYTDDLVDGQGSVSKTTVINTSKEIMCYSDFPAPKDFPNYMHHTKLMEYFRMYANAFDLEKYIQFGVEVKKVAKADDFATSGRWDIEVHNRSTGETKAEVFDAVLLCTGHHADKNVPRFKGDDVFKGKIIHTHDYRNYKGFEDKRIVVIGIGNSGGDAAVDFSRIAKQVYLSTRRGAWIHKRVGENGVPSDLILFRRVNMFLGRVLPVSMKMDAVEARMNKTFNHEAYGLRPKHRVMQMHPTMNDELPNRIICGSVIVKPDVKRFTETGVEFEDGTAVEADVVVLATGYIFGFPYLQKGVIDVEKNKIDLFKYVFPPDLQQPTVAVVGFVQPVGAVNPISELQCRWAARVFKGSINLPSRDAMWADIQQKREAMARRYVESQRHTIQVDYIPYMDELARQAGCKPNLVTMLFKDPRLALACFFGTWSPYQYRLQGPGQWSGAREAILTISERVLAPFKTRRAEPEEKKGSPLKKLALLAILLAIFYKWFR